MNMEKKFFNVYDGFPQISQMSADHFCVHWRDLRD